MGNSPIYVWALHAVVLSVGSAAVSERTPAAEPLSQAHAHNDYRHARPLMDALDHGFCSVEADIFLVDSKLLVGHDRSELRKERTLQSLYLEPLRGIASKNGGRVYRDGPAVTLLIDIKSGGPQTYNALRVVLNDYRELVSGFEDGQWRQRAVQVVISGNRPVKEMTADSDRLSGIDGRLSDLESKVPAHLMPLISDRWSSHFSWRGAGQMPAEERARLQSAVRRAHAAGRRVRFWATPEEPVVWRELLDAGVDHINTDRLEQLQQFLLER